MSGLKENLKNEIQLKGTFKTEIDANSRMKKKWASSAGLRQKTQTLTSPPREGEPAGTISKNRQDRNHHFVVFRTLAKDIFLFNK